jgi:hypothetical protein
MWKKKGERWSERTNERASQGIIPGGSACSGGLRAYHRHIWKAVAYHRPTATAYFSP